MRDRRKYLQGALLVFGVIALLLYPLMLFWPSGWAWTPGQHEYETNDHRHLCNARRLSDLGIS